MPHTLSMADVCDCQGLPLASHSHAEWFPAFCVSATSKQLLVAHPFSCFLLFLVIPGLSLHSMLGRELQTGCHGYKTHIHIYINSHIHICMLGVSTHSHLHFTILDISMHLYSHLHPHFTILDIHI